MVSEHDNDGPTRLSFEGHTDTRGEANLTVTPPAAELRVTGHAPTVSTSSAALTAESKLAARATVVPSPPVTGEGKLVGPAAGVHGTGTVGDVTTYQAQTMRQLTRPNQTESMLRQAVEIVADPTQTRRAIKIVRAAVSRWHDQPGGHAFFADQIDVALDHLEASIREAGPNYRLTVIEGLRRHVDHAIEWANGNQYLIFAGQLALVRDIIEAVPS